MLLVPLKQSSLSHSPWFWPSWRSQTWGTLPNHTAASDLSLSPSPGQKKHFRAQPGTPTSSTCLAVTSHGSQLPEGMFPPLSLLEQNLLLYFFSEQNQSQFPATLSLLQLCTDFQGGFYGYSQQRMPSARCFLPSPKRARLDKVISNNSSTDSYQQEEHQQFIYNIIKTTSLFSHW